VDPDTGDIVFTPDPGASVNDVIKYQVSDQWAQVSNPAFVWITVMHDAPTATDDWETTAYDEDVEIDVLANDLDGTAGIDPGSVQILTQPAHGSAAADPATGVVTYSPNGTYSGSDSFTYRVADDDGVSSNDASVDITVMNAPPEITVWDAWQENGGLWIFEGIVQDEHPETVTIDFGGLLSGSTIADATGYFSTTVTLPPGTFGAGQATATDELGLEYGPVYAEVFPY
jgi:hypothetical protein